MPQLTARHPDAGPGATSLDLLARRAAASLQTLGVSWQPIAARHGLRLDGEPDGAARNSTVREHAFLAEAADASGDPLFLCRVGSIAVGELGLVDYAALNAPTVDAALEIFAAALPAIRESASLHLTNDGDVASLVGVNAIAQPIGLIGVRVVLNLLRELIGPGFVPLRVGLPATEAVDLNAIGKQLVAPLVNEQAFSFIIFPARHLRARVAGADERLAATLRLDLRRLQAELAGVGG